MRQDTISTNAREIASSFQLADNHLLLYDYNSNAELSPIDNNLIYEYLVMTIRYNPGYLLKYIYDKNPDLLPYFENDKYAGYKVMINKVLVEFKIRKSDYLIEKVRTRYDDISGFGKSLGDMEDIYYYSSYTEQQGIYIPQLIRIEKLNGKISDKIEIRQISVTDKAIKRWEASAPQKEGQTAEIEITRYSDHIHLINIKEENTIALLVEFENFFVAVEAPKRS
ncbi:hypothetical protein [Dysgonomonas macrotermitis]|uniref:Uncharacterized protein n=1 Tax=Dysgonomonas macrotermitis TaxID=1346286 RepID=A0A1M5G5T2_9BACT|nr:hypothetical protein [Dysgonomonas macrotermitis]SHF99086.1 hypothetical protein SAMN05444362_11363 [Dysgonomonas macrotermitis]